MPGPLAGLTIVEMAGLGPGPFAAMMLADHGAEVIRIERPGNLAVPNDPLTRSRRSLAIDLKTVEGVAIARRLAQAADGLIEGYRPGVMERLGLGPDVLLGDNPKLVYGRVTGWGQEGPLAQAAGHDINYLALTGLLAGLGPKAGPPTAPANYLADFAGGGMMLAFAMVAALLDVARVPRDEGCFAVAIRCSSRHGSSRRRGDYPRHVCRKPTGPIGQAKRTTGLTTLPARLSAAASLS